MVHLGTNQGSADIPLQRRGSATLRMTWAAVTDTGHQRERNEDSLVSKLPIFAVADGMGGHAAGDVASAMVARRLSFISANRPVSAASIERALRRAARDMGHILQEEGQSGGTTVTGVALTRVTGHPHWLAFNVGDSRVYGWAPERLRQITVDHSLVELMVQRGEIAREEARDHPDGNIITRAISYRANTTPDYWLIPLQADTKIVVCSDGITKEITDERIAQVLEATGTAQEAADALLTAALDEGGQDNASVIVLQVDEA